jgi:hypothetical protein
MNVSVNTVFPQAVQQVSLTTPTASAQPRSSLQNSGEGNGFTVSVAFLHIILLALHLMASYSVF